MINVAEIRPDCYGCGACGQACPKGCIAMREDDEGFAYPVVDEQACVHCGQCNRTCPLGMPQAALHEPLHAYACVHTSPKIWADSASGGVFSALAGHILSQGGAVVGCALDEDARARHVVVEDRALLHALRGSKYVQSDTGDTYRRTALLLEQGRPVLYSGTPCQIAGLRRYLEACDTQLLVTVDLVCHGVPSPALFTRHMQWLGGKSGGDVQVYRFRSKVYSGKTSYFYYFCGRQAKLYHGTAALDPYYMSFAQAQTYRESCYRCRFSTGSRAGDFTLGDYWGVHPHHPGFPQHGTSAVMVNTPKAEALLESIRDTLRLEEAAYENIKTHNHNLRASTQKPPERALIYKKIGQMGYDAWASSFCRSGRWRLIRLKKAAMDCFAACKRAVGGGQRRRI